MEQIRRFAEISFRKAEDESKKNTCSGVACVFNSVTDLGWFTEEIDPHAFDECDMSDVVLNFNHDNSYLLAGTRNGSLSLKVTEEGLEQESTIVDTTQGRDVLKLLEEGLITKMSFAFTIDPKGGEEWKDGEEKEHRIIKKIDHLYDVSLVTFPAYESTSVGLRNIDSLASEHIALLERRAMQDRKMKELVDGKHSIQCYGTGKD